jgi:hypothetical protein
LIQAVRYLPRGESAHYDSVLSTTPYYSIEATDIANRSYRLDLYPPIQQDPAVLGKLPDGQAVLISREDFNRIDRKKSQFAR